jgi:predicted DNA-binding protein
MVRIQVYITTEQQKTLKRLARRARKTEAEFIRDAIEREDRMAAWREIETGIDRRAKPRAASTRRTWKRADLYDRDETTSMAHRRLTSKSRRD